MSLGVDRSGAQRSFDSTSKSRIPECVYSSWSRLLVAPHDPALIGHVTTNDLQHAFRVGGKQHKYCKCCPLNEVKRRQQTVVTGPAFQPHAAGRGGEVSALASWQRGSSLVAILTLQGLPLGNISIPHIHETPHQQGGWRRSPHSGLCCFTTTSCWFRYLEITLG